MHMLGEFLSNLPAHVPTQVNNSLRGTLIEDFYDELRLRTVEQNVYEFDTPSGELTLVLPTDLDWLVDKANNNRLYEPGLLNVLSDVFSQKKTFYDVGAHVGFISKFSFLSGVPGNSIYSFEPNRFNRYYLRQNCADLGINILPTFVDSYSDSDTTSLDDFRDDHSDQPDIVKIDVEGGEYDVLQGMTSILQKDKPVVFVEVHPEFLHQRGICTSDVIEFFQKRNYDLYVMNHRESDISWKQVNSDFALDDLPLTYLLKCEHSN